MRGIWLAAIVSLLLGAPLPARQNTPARDAVTPALATLRATIMSGDSDRFRAMLSPDIPSLDALSFQIGLLAQGVTAVTMRERDCDA